MKKSLLALAALGAFASAAQAENSVTLFGLIDTGVNYVSHVTDANGNSGSRFHLSNGSGGLQGSRWGLSGTQDIDNGLKAVFTLENGFDINNGVVSQDGQFFGRQAFVGLNGDFGTVTIGRQYDSISDFVSPLTESGRWRDSFAAHLGDMDNLNNTRRIDRSIKYISNSYEGLSFGGLYSVGGVAGHPSANQVWSAGIGYNNGPLALGAAYLNARNPKNSFFTRNDVLSDPFSTAQMLQIITAGGTFDFGALTAGVNYSSTQFRNINDVDGEAAITGNVRFHIAEANLAYHFSPDLVGTLSYHYTWSSKFSEGKIEKIENKPKVHQVNVRLSQNLSKSVQVYMLGAYQKAKGNKYCVALINGVGISETRSQALIRAGVRVAF